jgi:ketosteroid isomerase-like protein
MLRITTYALGALGIVFALGASAASAAPRDEMLAADKAFSAMSAVKGAHAAFLAYMADDVLLYEGAHPPIAGKAAAAAYYADQEKKTPTYGTQRLEWTPTGADASEDGSLGYTHGTWTLSAKKADGSEVHVTGYYVTEWRRQADGKYKFVADIGGAYGP